MFDVFDVSFGPLSIDEITVELLDLFTLTATDLHFFSAPQPADPDPAIERGRIGSISVVVSAGSPLDGFVETGVFLNNASIYDDRIEFSNLQDDGPDAAITLSGLLMSGDTVVLDVDDLSLQFTDLTFYFGGFNPFADQAVTIAPGTGFATSLDGVSVSLDHGALLPAADGTALAQVSNLVGSFDSDPSNARPDGTLVVTIGDMSASILDSLFTLSATDSELLIAPVGEPINEPLLSVATADLTLQPTPGAYVTLQADGLKFDPSLDPNNPLPIVTIDSASLSTSPPVGVGATLGLGAILPFDVTEIIIDGGGTPISLSDPEFDFTVSGAFNFALLDALPFEPFIQIGEDAQNPGDPAPLIFDDQSSNFTFDFHVDATPPAGQPPITISTIGPFAIGFAELELIENVTLSGAISFGQFVDGRFDGQLGGALRLRGGDPATNPTPDEPYLDVTLQVDAQITSSNVADAIVTVLNATMTGVGSGRIGDGPTSVTVEDAQFIVNMALQNTATPTQPFDFSTVCQAGENEPCPLFRLEEFDTGFVTIALGDFITLTGQAEIDGTAGPGDPKFFLREAGVTFDDRLGPLAGIGGSAGGFALSGDGNTVFVLSDDPATSENEGAFVELSAPTDASAVGLPDWLPLAIRKIGLRFNGPSGDDDVNVDGNSDDLGLTVDGGVRQFAPLLDPANFSLLVSGGLQSSDDAWPIEAQVERLAVDLGKLADLVASAASETGLTSGNFNELEPWRIFAALQNPADFPITNLDGVNFGIEPFDLGPLRIGGGVGFGVLEVEREEGNAATAEQVFFARVEGELAVADVGLGVEVIITQYGPVVARVFAGVPIPIGTIVGSVVPVLGTAIGTASGFILTGLQGGIVFGGDPLPMIEDAADIFTTPEIRSPLDVSLGDVIDIVTPLVRENPTFAELIAAAQDAGLNDFDLATITQQLISGQLPLPGGQSYRFTWDEGFRIAVSGVLTNTYVTGMIGAGVTLGANVGYDLQQILQPNGTPVVDQQGYVLESDGTRATDENGEEVRFDENGDRIDASGNPFVDEAAGAILNAFDAFGFQLYGLADLDIVGQSLVGAGLLLDYSDLLNPTYNVAASLPGKPGSLLSMLLPAQGDIGLQLDTKGLNEGSLVATIAFFESLINDVVGEESSLAGPLFSAALDRIADKLEANRLVAQQLGITQLPLPAGFTPDFANPLWIKLLDRDRDGVLSSAEQQTEISRDLLRIWLSESSRASLSLDSERRFALDDLGIDTTQLTLPADYDPDPLDPLWMILLDLDADGDNTLLAGEQRIITGQFLRDRLFGDASQSIPGLIPALGDLQLGTIDNAAAELTFETFTPGAFTDLLLLANRLSPELLAAAGAC